MSLGEGTSPSPQPYKKDFTPNVSFLASVIIKSYILHEKYKHHPIIGIQILNSTF